MKFKPIVAIGSGGYVSGPAIFGSDIMGAKIILLEQNVYPGVTTRLLEKYAEEIHLSFEDSKKYFKKPDKLKITGNPIRENLKCVDKISALKSFDLSLEKKTILILGGSLGAASINKAISNNIENFIINDIQIIWQTGKNYIENYRKYSSKTIIVIPFIENMNLAYSACDLVISRAGGITITEIINLGLPSILIPSPNVAENHQYLNAKNLFDNNAAIFIEDSKIESELWQEINSTITDNNKLSKLKTNALQIAKPEATKIVAECAIKLADI